MAASRLDAIAGRAFEVQTATLVEAVPCGSRAGHPRVRPRRRSLRDRRPRVPSFRLLQNRQRRRSSLVYFVFDLLWLDGDDLRGLPIEECRGKLEQVVAAVDRQGAIV